MQFTLKKFDLALLTLMSAVCAVLLPDLAFAAGGGFAQKAESMIKNIADGITLIIAVVAVIALIWQLAEGFMGRKTWPEVLGTCFWIVGAGAAAPLANWLFTSGTSMTF